MLSRIDAAFKAQPFVCSFITSSIVTSMGDIAAQRYEHYLKSTNNSTTSSVAVDSWQWDHLRTFKVSVWGMLFAGPSFVWLKALERRWPGRSPRMAATKVIANQSVISPIHNGCFYGWVSWWAVYTQYKQQQQQQQSKILEHQENNNNNTNKNGDDDAMAASSHNLLHSNNNLVAQWRAAWWTKIEKELITTQINANMAWLPIHMVGFSFVPLRYYLFYQSFFGVCWNGYLSYIGHRKVMMTSSSSSSSSGDGAGAASASAAAVAAAATPTTVLVNAVTP